MSQPIRTGRGTGDVTGECPICHRTNLAVVKTTGLLWRHGPNENPCPGSNLPPTQRSIQDGPTGGAHSSQQSPDLDDTSIDLFDTEVPAGSGNQMLTQPQTDVHHPRPGTSLIKRLPKGVRTQASALLVQVLNDVVKAPEQPAAWMRLFGFAHACFRKPRRGGKVGTSPPLLSVNFRIMQQGGKRRRRGRSGARGYREGMTKMLPNARPPSLKMGTSGVRCAP